jgi:hypothetical protein
MQDELKINGTEDTPTIDFTKSSGSLSISGRSLPEDAFSFYEPVLNWLKEYSHSPAQETLAVINLEYFNTASAKQIFKMVNLLTEISKKAAVKIKWHYDDGDKDMYASGERFSKLSSMPFEFVKN